MAAIERKTKRYPSDLTDEEWEGIAPLLPKPSWRGRKPGVAMREVLNAIRYMALSGGGWRMLPKDFPPWQTVYWWFRRFVRLMDRECTGREASPSAGVNDSQTVKAPGATVEVWPKVIPYFRTGKQPARRHDTDLVRPADRARIFPSPRNDLSSEVASRWIHGGSRASRQRRIYGRTLGTRGNN